MLLPALQQNQLLQDVVLAPYTTFEVGGPADYFAMVTNRQDLVELSRWASEQAFPLLILGGGSNLLIADSGFRGLAVRLDLRGVTGDDTGLFRAEAGEPWDDFVAYTVERGFYGIECLSGIPGTVGAAPIQNIGAYGQEVCETIVSVEVFDRSSGEFLTLRREECGFGYRQSRFKQDWSERYLVVSVVFQLSSSPSALRYGELSRALEEMGSYTGVDIRRTVVSIRRSKSMVHDRSDANHRSAGSFFMNPVVSEARAAEIESLAIVAGKKMPRFPAGAGEVKLSAAWLIEQAGFPKGYLKGPAGLSTNHVLALTNRGAAKCRDIWSLAQEIQAGVDQAFGVQLHPEPVRIGVFE
jgi:UDP-N-acetylmuramate dehydrogenase